MAKTEVVHSFNYTMVITMAFYSMFCVITPVNMYCANLCEGLKAPAACDPASFRTAYWPCGLQC